MAIPGITYRLQKGSTLTHLEMDNNFRSVFYSSSLHDDGATLRLHFNTEEEDYYVVPLGGSSTGSVSIIDNVNNYILTATGLSGSLQGEPNFSINGDVLTITGRVSQDDGNYNIFIGEEAGDTISGAQANVGIGYRSSRNLSTGYNTALGVNSLLNAVTASSTVALGFNALTALTSGSNNVSVGASAGINLTSGAGNVHLGNAAGPASSTAESNKLYINNAASDTPLILGDFSTGQVTFNSQVSASVFSGSFYGDGSNLTGLSVTTEWDGSRNGDAEITGSFTVSGSGVNVDFTNAEAGVSGSFSGSFVGDGSGLTGVQADTFPYTGSAGITGSLAVVGPTSITGSFTVSGSNPTINLKGDTTIDTNIKICNPSATGMAIGANVYANTCVGNTNALSVAIGYQAGQYSRSGCHVAIGANAGKCIGYGSIYVGMQAGECNCGTDNIAIGRSTMVYSCATSGNNIAIGNSALYANVTGTKNIAIGPASMLFNMGAKDNVVVGYSAALSSCDAACGNVVVGTNAGEYRILNCNVIIGYKAGPTLPGDGVSNKLYINNNSGNPLIGGDFAAKTVTISGSMYVSQSITADTYYGDGSNLTGFEWDGTHFGNANITGSFTVSGSTDVVDFTNVAAISGSIFSGSFVGDGTGLTGITTEWDGTLNGDAEITGSLIVSGNLDVAGTLTIASGSYPGGPGVEFIQYNASGLTGTTTIYTFLIDGSTGYTGIKADYVLTNSGEDEKKVGTILGGWDQSGGSTINDSHTAATGNIVGTSFSIDASSTNEAILQIDASPGTYELNMLITAFKRSL